MIETDLLLQSSMAETWSPWEAMRTACGNGDLFQSAAYLSAWLESFGSAAARPTIVEGRFGVLGMPTVERRAGLPIRTWRLCVNDHSQRGPVLCPIGREQEAARSLVAFFLERRRDFDAFRLGGLPIDPPFADAVVEAAQRAGMPVDRDFQRTHYALDMASFDGFQAFLETRGTSTRHTMRKQMKRLQRLGRLGVEVAEGDRLPAAFADYMAVEQRSWKSKRGEIFASDATVERFNRNIIREFDRIGGARIWSLRLDDQIIASAITVREKQRCTGLKLVFDEAHAAHSPGRLLLQQIIERMFSEDCRIFDFFSGMEIFRYWASMEWTFQDMTLWSPTLRGRTLALARRGHLALKSTMGGRNDHAPVKRGSPEPSE